MIPLITAAAAAVEPCRIEVVEKGSGWPVPLVELRTVHGVRLVSDNAGIIAFDLPELMGRETWFDVHGHGYEVPKDGFGMRGVRLTPGQGKTLRIEVRRTIIAQRIGRLTGGGLFAESQKVGLHHDWRDSGILGCDSVQNALHRGRLWWVWGDTLVPGYPLGIFHATNATTAVRPLESFEPPLRLRLDYITDDKGMPRATAKLPGDGPTWITGYVSLPDREGNPRLVASYLKVKPPMDAYLWGLAVWDDQDRNFQPLRVLWTKAEDTPKPPPMPEGHPTLWKDEQGRQWALFGNPFPTLRCPATFEAWQDPATWEVLKPQELVSAAGAGDQIKPHSGSIAWHPWRKRWVTVFMQQFGKPSAFGELWYAEAGSPTGPWGPAVKILSHDDYTFYNPRLHPEFTADGSPLLFFEGTYTIQFSGNKQPTPRYDYNQILYRLDLSDQRLAAAQGDAKQLRPVTLEWIRPSGDRTHFVRAGTGERIVMWGFNYDHDDAGRLLEDYWADEWTTVVEDFREMKALGGNVVRVHLQVAQFMQSADRPNRANLQRLEKLVRLAEETGLYLDITGLGCYHKQDVPGWYDALPESERWEVQARFWKHVAAVCRESPAIFCYDLMNEPVLAGGEGKKEWLVGEPLGGKYFVQRITLDPRGRSDKEIAKAWVQKLTSAIRSVDDRHMITVGVIPWAQVFKGARPLFYSPEVGGPLDFVSVHFYPKGDDVDESLKVLKVYDVGKPLVIEEIFPLQAGVEKTAEFITRSQSHVDGVISFYWGRTIDECRRKGDLAGALTGQWLERFTALSPYDHRGEQKAARRGGD